eukprot:Gb_02542 [translate_table: standard]
MACSSSKPVKVEDGGVEPKESNKRVVCVTGASGYIGSWLVMRLLERGYYVHGTVRDPENHGKVAHLLKLPGASEKLKLFKADLNDETAFDDAVNGCEGVFHVASPVNLNPEALQGEVVGPAVRGTIHLLRSCKRSSSVKRIIHTSSVSAVMFPGKNVPNDIVDESYWTSVDHCRKNKIIGWMYFIAKTYAEEGALKFGMEQDMDVISILPAVTVGDFLTPDVPGSVATLMALTKGDEDFLSYIPRLPYVHIDDVARAYIFLYEHPDAKGRYICSLKDVRIEEAAELLSKRYPEINVPTKFENLREDYICPCVDSGKLKRLGFECQYSIEDIIDDVVKSYKARGLL